MKINEYTTKFYSLLHNDETPYELKKYYIRKKEPEFLKSEIEYLVEKLKNNKTPEHDKITFEQIKYGEDLLYPILQKI